MSRNGMAEALVAYLTRQGERDEDAVAALAGTGEELRRARAVTLLGVSTPVAAGIIGSGLRGKARHTGTLTPEEAERLVAAEIVEGQRTEIGREAEALLREVNP